MFFSQLKIPASYHLIDTYKKLVWLQRTLLNVSEFAFDIETNHPTTKSDDAQDLWQRGAYAEQIVGVSYAWGRNKHQTTWKPGIAAYVPLAHADESPFWGERQLAAVEVLRNIQKSKAFKVAQNGKFDISKLLPLLSAQTSNFGFDTMLAHSLLDEENLVSSHGLKSKFSALGAITTLGMSDAYLSLGSSEFKRDLDDALKYYDPKFLRYSKVPLDILYPYGCADSDLTLALKYAFEPLLAAEGLTWDFENIQMPLQRRLMHMEMYGVPLDIPRATAVLTEQRAKAEKYSNEIQDLLGVKFNVGSTQKLGKLFFEEMGLPGGVRNKQGWVVDSDFLKALDHPVAPLLLKYRRAIQIGSTYAEASLESVGEVQGSVGWVHTDYFIPSKTGRLKSRDPNLSQLPRKENGGEIVKGLYNCPEGYRFVFMDESQIELRVIAHLSQEPVWIDGFNRGEDMHAAMAVKAFNLDCAVSEVEELYPDKRSSAKTVNFGIAYGRTIPALAKQLDISVEEADELVNVYYFGSAPRLKDWIDETHQFVKDFGYVPTIFGRRRHLPDGMLRPVQGMKWPRKEVMPRCYRDGPYLKELGISLEDVRDLSVYRVRDQVRTRNLKKHFKCLSCPYITSCLVNRERKFVNSKINAAMRQAVNSPVQGTAVEMVHLCAIWIGGEFKKQGLDANLVLHIHDELGAIVKSEHVEAAGRIMHYYMTTYLREFTQFSVPLEADAEVCQRWSDKGKHLEGRIQL